MSNYSFQTLPIHDQPRQLESFTSWLRRIGAENFLPSVDALIALCFPTQSRRVARHVTDYPPLVLEPLVNVTNCSVTDILATTFRPLGQKFGRSPHPQALSRFLHGSISETLRFCPSCIRETGYYKLTWRFPALAGCPSHYCHILDHCTHCESRLPLFSASFEIDQCPTCGNRLSSCHAPALSQEARGDVELTNHDLIEFLAPQPWESYVADVIVDVGKQFALLRQLKRETIRDVAEQLNITTTVIEGIERGNIQARGAAFRDYFVYARFLGVTLADLWNGVIPPVSQIQENSSHKIASLSTNDIRRERASTLLRAVEQAAQELEIQGRPVTLAAIGNLVQLTPQGLKKYPQVATFMSRYTAKNVLKRRMAHQQQVRLLIERAQEVAAQLRASGQTVSQRAIARALSIPWSSLRTDPSVRDWLQKLSQEPD